MDELFCQVEYRQDESRQTPGRLVGVLLPYERRAGDRPEMFEAGSLYWPDRRHPRSGRCTGGTRRSSGPFLTRKEPKFALMRPFPTPRGAGMRS